MNEIQSPNCSITASSRAAKIGFTFAYCLIFVVSLAGNSLIAIIVYRTKPMQKAINYLIVNMAMSDLLFPVIILPSHVIELYDGFAYFPGHLGRAFWTLRLFLIYLSCTLSLECLVLIAVDRFAAVVFPLRAPLLSSKLCPVVILATWFVSIALSSPIFFSYDPGEYTNNMECEWFWKDGLASYYTLVKPVVFPPLILFLIIILYSVIIFKLKTQKMPGEQSVNAERRRMKVHQNVFKMVGAIVIGFVLCWGPNSVFSFLNVSVWDNNTSLSCDTILFWYISGFLMYANCAVNPCLCFAFSGNYRQGLKGLLGCCGTSQGQFVPQQSTRDA